MRFTPFENLTALRNIGVLLEEELFREAPIKAGSNWKGNHQNMDKKYKGDTSKKVHALDCYIEYFFIGTIPTISDHQSEKWGHPSIHAMSIVEFKPKMPLHKMP